MQRLLLSLLVLCLTLAASAQQARKDIERNHMLSASNYLAYPGPLQKKLTPAPRGKKPFYISHYGRHGSRYLISQRQYSYAYETLLRGDLEGKLSPLGKDVLHRLELIKNEADNRLGELTPLGARQHKEIARRMYERFPEVFQGDVCIDAKSTVVIRCILSMENALQQLLLLNPRLRITHDASEHDMYYMNLQDRKLTADVLGGTTREAYDAYCKKRECWQRTVNALYNDTAFVSEQVNGARLNHYLFKLCCNLQSSELGRKITLYDLYTNDELYKNWQTENVFWYLGYGHSPLNGGKQPFTQRNLLRRIIEQADSCLHLPAPGATLRYGHETMVMPLACLMGIDGYDMAVADLEQLEGRGWLNYRIFPMAANIQLVFYRSSPSDRDVLVKVLLNENETTLPIDTDCAPYYHWNQLRKYYLDKLASYVEPDVVNN